MPGHVHAGVAAVAHAAITTDATAATVVVGPIRRCAATGGSAGMDGREGKARRACSRREAT